MVDGRNFFDQPVKNSLITFYTFWKIATGERDDYTTSCLLVYNYFNSYYKIIAIDLSKWQALDAAKVLKFYFVLIKYQCKMTQRSTLNIKSPNSQLNKLKSEIKNNTQVTLKILSNVVGDSNDKNNFPHNFLLTNTQVSKLRKAFANNSSVNIKLSKTQLHKIGKSGRFLSRLWRTLLEIGLHLIGNVLKPLAKSALIQLELTTAASTTDAAIYNKMFGSGNTTLLILSEEMNDIMKVFKSL